MRGTSGRSEGSGVPGADNANKMSRTSEALLSLESWRRILHSIFAEVRGNPNIFGTFREKLPTTLALRPFDGGNYTSVVIMP